MNAFLVFLGGGLGAALRYGLNVAVPRVVGGNFPWHTLFINVSGCLVMGIISSYVSSRMALSVEWRLFLMTGVLGGYTTFSAFALDFAGLAANGEQGAALAYAFASVIFSIAACFAGIWLVRAFLA